MSAEPEPDAAGAPIREGGEGGAGGEGAEPQLPPYKLEAARSSRSRCRTCRRAIDKGVLRLGILLEGPYGTGYLWHHLTCAAKRRLEDVEAAYAAQAWEPGVEVPPLDGLRALEEEAREARAKRRDPPWIELAPTGRARCKHCNEPIEKGSPRVVLLREVSFGNQTRGTPIHVHPACVAAELLAEDCRTEAEGLHDLLAENSQDLAPADLARALEAIGEVG